jgi:hypothetical protein
MGISKFRKISGFIDDKFINQRAFCSPMPKLVAKQKADPDTILDESDLRAIAQYEKEKAEGRLIPFERLMKELEERGVVRRRAR